MRSDQVAVATTCVVATAIAAAIIAPRIDGTRPWFNYEAFAEKLEPTKAEAFSWTHSYGPMTWSRDGRELLRIKAPSASYWKATNLDEFDGVRWREGPPSRDALVDGRAQPRAGYRPSRSSIAGCARRSSSARARCEDILPGSSRLALPQSDGTFVTSTKPLRPGDSYQAQVYVPHPTDNQLRRSGTNYPGYTQDFLEVRVPLRGASAGLVDQATGRPLGASADMRFTAYGTPAGAGIVWPSGFGVQQDGDERHGRLALRPALRPDPADPARHQVALRLRAGGPGPRAAGHHL